jgi:uncharacterized protein YjiS (DUF1127 family)
MVAVFFSGVAGQVWRSVAAFAVFVADCFARLIKERQYRADIRKLQSMSDRELRDMGLNRESIANAVRGKLE